MSDVLGTSSKLPIIWSRSWVLQMYRGRPHLQQMNICFFSKKQQQVCKTKNIASEKHFFHQIINFFCWSPKSPLKVPWRSPGGPQRQETFSGLPQNVACRLGVLHVLVDCNFLRFVLQVQSQAILVYFMQVCTYEQ